MPYLENASTALHSQWHLLQNGCCLQGTEDQALELYSYFLRRAKASFRLGVLVDILWQAWLISRCFSLSFCRRLLALYQGWQKGRVHTSALEHTLPIKVNHLLPWLLVEWFNSTNLLPLVFAPVIERDHCIKQAKKQLSFPLSEFNRSTFDYFCTLINIELNNLRHLQK